MKNISVKILLVSAGLMMGLLFALLFFYLPNIKFYKPVNITISGISEQQIKRVRINYITPLGRKGLMPGDVLTGNNQYTSLFSEILIDLDSIAIDSVSAIILKHGNTGTPISKNEIAELRSKQGNSILPMAKYLGDDASALIKLKAMMKMDWTQQMLRNIRTNLVSMFPLLLIIIGVPIAIIFILLSKYPISSFRIKGDETDLAKAVFFICLLAFLFFQLYGIVNYTLRLQNDAAGDMIFYSSNGPVLINTRLAYFLNKLLLRPAFLLHLPVNTVGKIYCFNDACFYLFIVGSILFLTRRYDYAAVVLAAPLLLSGINYYSIFNELFLSGAMMILYLAVYKYLRDGWLKNLILYPCLIFVIWSHLVALLLLAAFFAGLYRSWYQLIKDKWILAFILVNIIGRIFSLNGYDFDNLRQLSGGLGFGYLFRTGIDYCITFWYLIVIGVAGIYISITRYENLNEYRGLLIIPFIIYFCSSKQLGLEHIQFTKFTYPIHLLVLTQGIVLISRHGKRYRKTVLAFVGLALASSMVMTISNYHSVFKNKAVLIESLNTLCYEQDHNQSKWFVNSDLFKDKYFSTSYFESISFSAYQELPVNVQVIVGPQKLKDALDAVPEDQYYYIDNVTAHIKSLNPYYFHFHEGKYKELVLDSAKLNFIKQKVSQ